MVSFSLFHYPSRPGALAPGPTKEYTMKMFMWKIGLVACALFVGPHALSAQTYYNSYTGTYHSTAVANPYTGTAAAATTVHNPYTGTTATTAAAYNPYTGASAHGAAAYNPYTGAAAKGEEA